mmetsp:Transcript_12499/g.43463  ORF Transcript_12499/g.43463 Transcript_12499/m.43463 type:complete len:273 (+) Transcript_12499:2276-3094(+)
MERVQVLRALDLGRGVIHTRTRMQPCPPHELLRLHLLLLLLLLLFILHKDVPSQVHPSLVVLHELDSVRLSFLPPVHQPLQVLHGLQPAHKLLGLSDGGAEGEEGSVGKEKDPLPQPALLRARDAVNLVEDHVADPLGPRGIVGVHQQRLEALGDGDENAAGEGAMAVGVSEDAEGGVEGAVDLRGDLVDESLGGSDEDEDAVLVPAVPHDLLHTVVGDERLARRRRRADQRGVSAVNHVQELALPVVRGEGDDPRVLHLGRRARKQVAHVL